MAITLRSKIFFQEADFYGASKLVDWDGSQPFCYKASWMHGLGPVLFRDKVNSDVLLHYYERKLPLHLVNNSVSSNLLNMDGFNSIAVGMPFIYTKAFASDKIRRVYKKLFMPSHSISRKGQVEDYSEWKKIIDKYGCDSICVGGNDFNNIKLNNIDFGLVEVLKGAHATDSESLERISLMMKSAEEIVTNSSGSHIVYATASGANVTIIDEMITRATTRRKNLGVNKNILDTIPKKYQSSYFRHLNNSVVDDVIALWGSNDESAKKEYSNFILGVDERKSSRQVAEYLKPNGFLHKCDIYLKLLNARLQKKLF